MSNALLILLLLVAITLQLMHILGELMGAQWPGARTSRRHRRTGMAHTFRSDVKRASVAPWFQHGTGGHARGVRDAGEGESSWPSFLLN